MTVQRVSLVRKTPSWAEVRANVLTCALVVGLVLIPSGIGAVFIALLAMAV